MARLESSFKSARWVAAIRGAQMQRAEQDAVLAMAQEDQAREECQRANDESERAQAAWAEAVAAGKVLDPQVATLWAREAESRRVVLMDAQNYLACAEDALEEKRSRWASSVRILEQSEERARRLRNSLLREREEQVQFDLAEVLNSSGLAR